MMREQSNQVEGQKDNRSINIRGDGVGQKLEVGERVEEGAGAKRIGRDADLRKLEIQKFQQNHTRNTADLRRDEGAAATELLKRGQCFDGKGFELEVGGTPGRTKAHEGVQIGLDAIITAEELTNKNMSKKVNFS